MLSFLELVREEVNQSTFRIRQYAVLESLYRGTTGWRQALMFRLLHRFSDPLYLDAQQADEKELQHLRKIGFACEPPGELERQELLRLLEEEIAGVREEFEYAEKANEERAAIERDACLAPEGETWSMLLRQEGALDRSIDRKVRILLRLRKDMTDLPVAPAGHDDGGGMEDVEKAPESAIMSHNLQGVEAAENSKLKEQCANIYENKGPAFSNPKRNGNVMENKSSYGQNAGMLRKRKGVIGNRELHVNSSSVFAAD
jgi:hypothetical protein